MRQYWSETRPNGQPIDAGTACMITDLEDGSNVIPTYGATREIVLEKLARNSMHAQSTLARLAKSPANSGERTSAPPPATAPARLTPEERMQYTEGLSDPARAAASITALVQDETGIDLRQEAHNRWKVMADNWIANNQRFEDTMGNRRLLVGQAQAYTSTQDYTRTTYDMLTRAFEQLLQEGYLHEASADFADEQNQNDNLRTFPGESPVQRTERPRGRFASSVPSTRFRASQNAPPKTPKYSEEQLRKMSIGRQRELIENNDSDYAYATEYHFGKTATA